LKTSLEHLAVNTQDELNTIAKAIKQRFLDVEMIILYGDYASGNPVNETYGENETIHEYKSDYSLLIILDADNKANHANYVASIDKAILNKSQIAIPSPVYHGIDFVNRQIEGGNYFFNEIIEKGIRLFDSGRYKLSPPKKLDMAIIKSKAGWEFKTWFDRANSFFIDFQHGFDREDFNKTAFELHQAVEDYYTAILLVFTGYVPKIHDIEVLGKYVTNLDIRFKKVFPRDTNEEKYRYILLKKAYIDARYNSDFIIFKEELEYLSERVLLLKDLTERVCMEKIASY
jgi:HEPN domain-containing protein